MHLVSKCIIGSDRSLSRPRPHDRRSRKSTTTGRVEMVYLAYASDQRFAELVKCVEWQAEAREFVARFEGFW